MSLLIGSRLSGKIAYLVSGLPSTVILITTVIEWPGRVKRGADACADNTGKLLFYFLQYALSRLSNVA